MTMTVTAPSPETASRPARDWRRDAICVHEDPELFHPIGTSGPAQLQAAEAKSVCRRCPVVASCRMWALEVLEFGVAGGLTEDERRELNARRAESREVPLAPSPARLELDGLSVQARDALLAAGMRGRVDPEVGRRVLSELVRSRLTDESVPSPKSSSQGGIRANARGRAAIQAWQAREAAASAPQMALPLTTADAS